jgi:putative transposase
MRRRDVQPGYASCQMGNLGRSSALVMAHVGARRRDMQFVAASVGAEPIWKRVNRRVNLGSDALVQRMQDKAGDADDINVPRAHRRPPPPSLEAIAAAYPDRDVAMLAAHRTGEHSYAEIARHFGVHFTTLGRVVRGAGNL